MLKNHFKIAFRNLWKNKVFSLINIISLSIGLSASLVIGLMVYYDFSFDTFHKDGERTYRVTSIFTDPKDTFYNHGVAVPLGKVLKEDFPNVEMVSTFFTNNPDHVAIEGVKVDFETNKNIIFADENYFKLFTYTWLAGSPETTMENPNEVVLTQNRAKKYFPMLNARETMGKTIIYNDSVPAKVVGIVANFSHRSDLIFEEFISLKTGLQTDIKTRITDDNWNNTGSSSQVFIKAVGNPRLLQEELDKLAKAHADEQMLSFGQERSFHLQPLTDIHFNENYGAFDYSGDQASKSVLWGLASIALFLLLLGSINFINLNTAQAGKRAMEIGIRKTLGGSKKQLIFQFLGETLILTLSAGLLSVFLAFWLLHIFSDFIPSGLTFELLANPMVIVAVLVLLLIVTLLAGFYPAMVLSNFKPASVIKNQMSSGKKSTYLRKSLTVFQFVIAQVFIIGTLLVGKQINFLMAKDMGFKTDAIATLRIPWSDKSMNKRLQLTEQLKTIPELQKVSLGGNPPASFGSNSTILTYFNDDEESHNSVELLFGDENYLNLYDIKLLAGRTRRNDTIKEYVINKTYMKLLGIQDPQEAIGQYVKLDDEQIPIVGVVEDFNQRSLRTPIQPMAITGDAYRSEFSQFRVIHLSLDPKNTATWQPAIAQIENLWEQRYPEDHFQIRFVDETVARFYRQEQRTSILLKWATGLSVLISCLGLLGLVIYSTERRVKEIGVRKVLGASLAQLNLLLCKEFLILVAVAFLIASPIAWWQTHVWLQEFAYKTSISWWIFVLSGTGMLFLALLIMSIKTTMTANINPVKSLRTE